MTKKNVCKMIPESGHAMDYGKCISNTKESTKNWGKLVIKECWIAISILADDEKTGSNTTYGSTEGCW